jgi:hypothetical protein
MSGDESRQRLRMDGREASRARLRPDRPLRGKGDDSTVPERRRLALRLGVLTRSPKLRETLLRGRWYSYHCRWCHPMKYGVLYRAAERFDRRGALRGAVTQKVIFSRLQGNVRLLA